MSFVKTRQEHWARGAGLAMCLLVLVFAFAAKLSWYQPKGVEMHGLTSSKMWQHEAKAAEAMRSAPEDSGESASFVAVSFVLLVVVARWGLGLTAQSAWVERENSFLLRQARFARISHLRAPPVR